MRVHMPDQYLCQHCCMHACAVCMLWSVHCQGPALFGHVKERRARIGDRLGLAALVLQVPGISATAQSCLPCVWVCTPHTSRRRHGRQTMRRQQTWASATRGWQGYSPSAPGKAPAHGCVPESAPVSHHAAPGQHPWCNGASGVPDRATPGCLCSRAACPASHWRPCGNAYVRSRHISCFRVTAQRCWDVLD